MQTTNDAPASAWVVPALALDPTAALETVAATLEAQVTPLALACRPWPRAFPEFPRVRAWLAHSHSCLWLRFAVEEERIRALETTPQGDVYRDSCVELFIAFNAGGYYNLELNCIGTIHLGYGAGRHGRRPVPAEHLETLRVASSLGRAPFGERAGGFSWSLTACVPCSALVFDDLSAGLTQRGARANLQKCNSAVSVQHYLTWRPIDTPQPDFQRPEFFGQLWFGARPARA